MILRAALIVGEKTPTGAGAKLTDVLATNRWYIIPFTMLTIFATQLLRTCRQVLSPGCF